MKRKKDIKILVVEDEDAIRNIFEVSLTEWGYRVETATNGQQAIKICNSDPPHIIITDLYMPVMDGLTLLKRVKQKYPLIEVIIITGYATIENAIEAMKLGANDFILKPVNFEHVKFVVNKCYQKIKSTHEKKELQELNARLIELNELKDKFLAITNHEMRTPLTILKGYLEILEMLIPEPSEEIKDVLNILNITTRELGEVVDRMHYLYNFYQGKQLDMPVPVEIVETAGKVAREMSLLFKHRNIDFKYELPRKKIRFKAPPKSIQLMLRELLHNALKFTPDGGKVDLKLEAQDGFFIIKISDTGIGIPYEKQPLIFKDFYEVQDTNRHSSSNYKFMGGGMGIGLALVKEIVEEMHGEIYVESTPGEGSTFTIVIPIKSSRKKELRHELASSLP